MTDRGRLGLLLFGVLAPLFVFAAVAFEVSEDEPSGWDASVFRTVRQFGDDDPPVLDQAFDFFGDVQVEYVGLVVVVFVFGLLLLRRRFLDAAFLALSLAAGAAVPALKDAFEQPPPEGGGDSYAFPSGHAVGSMLIAAALVVLLWRTRWRWSVLSAAAVLVFAIGFSVVAEGVHWPSDVVGGWGFALAWVSALALVRAAVARPSRPTRHAGSASRRGRGV